MEEQSNVNLVGCGMKQGNGVWFGGLLLLFWKDVSCCLVLAQGCGSLFKFYSIIIINNDHYYYYSDPNTERPQLESVWDDLWPAITQGSFRVSFFLR